MSVDNSFLDDRIAACKNLIIAYETALQFFADNGSAQSYRLDTGQTQQSVQRANLTELRNMLSSQENRLETLCARRTGSGTFNMRPTW